MAEIVMRRRFQLTEVGNNHNKTWEIYRLDDGRVISEWGRVGSTFQKKDYGQMGDYWIESKISEKLAKGYREVELARPQVVASGLSPVDPQVERITRIIFEEAGESIAQTTAAPVDQLSVDQIEEGRKLLKDLSAFSNRYNPLFVERLQDYWNTIPTVLPRNLRDKQVIADLARSFDFAAEEQRLDQLEAAVRSLVVTGSGGSQYSALGAELTWLAPSDARHNQILKVFNATRYRQNVQDIYLVHIPDERARYEASTRGKHFIAPALFHGTNTAYIRHILRMGLKIPSTHANGGMFGKGVYFGDKAAKSETYLRRVRSSAPHMMLVCEVALGTIKEMRDEDKSLREAPKGYDSVMGKAGWTLHFGGPGTLRYNEFVVYDPAQITVRALLTLR